MSEAEAIAAAMQIQADMRKGSSREQYTIARLIGSLVAIFSTVGLIMVRCYMRLRGGQYRAGPLLTVLLAVLLVCGLVTYVWALVGSSRLKK